MADDRSLLDRQDRDERVYLLREARYQALVIVDLLEDRQVWREMALTALGLLHDATREIARLKARPRS